MLQIIEKYLQRIGVEYSIRDNDKVFDFEVQAPEGQWNCMLLLHGRAGIGFYSVLPIVVQEQQRAEVALYLMWLNNERVFGNFELDLETGEVRFKTYIDCECNPLTERMLDRTMLINVATMQKYLPKIIGEIRQIKVA
jgi:hypothetical protein